MAIDKKLIHFKTGENFISSTGVNGNYTTPSSGTEDDGTAIYGQVRGTSIVFIKDVGKIGTHGKLYDNSIEIDEVLSDTSTNPIQNKAVSIALDNKVDKVTGKRLSTEDFTTALKTKLESLTNYDDTAIQNAVNGLTTQLNTLVNGDASTAIESFNEIIAFLNGVTDSENLDSIIASIEQQIAGKMDAVTLAKVATSGSYNDLNDKPTIPAAVTESTVSGWGFTKNTGTYSKPSAGIPKSDLTSDVQASLGKADSAIQNIKTINGEFIVGEGNIEIKAEVDTSEFATKEELAEAEEVSASAFNDLNERIRAINDTLYGVTATKEELKSEVDKISENFTTIITDNEEVTAAAFNDLNEKIRNAATKEELEFEVSKLDERTAYVREVSETTLSIESNKYYKWTAAVSSLEITLTTPKDTKVLNNYMMEFTTSSTGCSLTLPTTIKWANGEIPTLEANITYQVSIINNLAIITKFL